MSDHTIKLHNVINLSEVRSSINQSGMTGALVASSPEKDPSFDKMISEPILDAISKNEALLKDVGSKINDSIQTINRFAEAAFQSETFKQFSDNLNVAVEVIEKNMDSFAGLFTNIGLFKKTCNYLISIGRDPEEEFRGFYKHNSDRLLEVPKEVDKPLPEVIRIRRNPILQEKLFVAELLQNKTAIYFKIELYARSKLWERNKENDTGAVNVSKLIVALSNSELMDLQGKKLVYRSRKSDMKDRLRDNLFRLNAACSSCLKFPMFKVIQETIFGVLVEFHPIYVTEYFKSGCTTLHYAAKWLYMLDDIVEIKVAQKMIDHTSNHGHRRNKSHTTLSFESLLNSLYVDRGLSTPKAINDAKDKLAKDIRKALISLDNKGFIVFNGWKEDRDKTIHDDCEIIRFTRKIAIDDKLKVSFRIPNIERYFKEKEKKSGSELPDTPLN